MRLTHKKILAQIVFLSAAFNNLQAAGDCLRTWKYVEDGYLACDFTGEDWGLDAQPLVEGFANSQRLRRSPLSYSSTHTGSPTSLTEKCGHSLIARFRSVRLSRTVPSLPS